MPPNQTTTAPVDLDAPTSSGSRCTSPLTKEQKGITSMSDPFEEVDALWSEVPVDPTGLIIRGQMPADALARLIDATIPAADLDSSGGAR